MITAWWFNNVQTESDVLQPDFFVPKTHFRIDAKFAGEEAPTEIRIAAYLDGEVEFEKSYVEGFTIHIAEGISILSLTDFTESLHKNPERLLITIHTDNETHTSDIECTYVTLSGQITDFEGKPFQAMVAFNRNDFEAIPTGLGVWSDAHGRYSITLPAGAYNSIVVTDNTIWKTSLEGWCWRMTLDQDETHDFKIGNGEVYSLNAWTDNGGIPNLFIFFRPMVLPHLKADNYDVENSMKNGDYNIEINGNHFSVADIAPELEPSHLRVTINGNNLDILSIQKIYETSASGGVSMPAYIVQTPRINKGDKQTLIVEYDTGKFKSQGRMQFYYNSLGLMLI